MIGCETRFDLIQVNGRLVREQILAVLRNVHNSHKSFDFKTRVPAPWKFISNYPS